MTQQVTARQVVLNLVRVSPGQSVEVRHLVEIGRLFGLAGNAVRVAVTRLTAVGLLESDERGSYRLGPAAAAVGQHVEQWRRGEGRVRTWNGGLIAAALPPKPDRGRRRDSLRALTRLGLREGLPGLWVRPDNLRQHFARTVEDLAALGLEGEAELFVMRRVSDRMRSRVIAELWPTAELARGYARCLHDLRRSLEQLPGMPQEQALVQTFMLGGHAIGLLARDPLLPAEIMSVAGRAELTQVMLQYDAVGHRVWRRYAARPELRLVQGDRDAG